MKKLIMQLIFFTIISPKVWGNDFFQVNTFTLTETQYISYTLPQHETSRLFENHLFLSTCSEGRTSLQINNSINLISEQTTYCNEISDFSETELLVGFEIGKKDKKNKFTVSIQGGINLGFEQEDRRDGTKRLKFRANVSGEYDWGFMKGSYKFVARLIKPGSFPNNNFYYNGFNDDNFNQGYRGNHIEGMIFNRDPYFGIKLTF